MKNWYYFFTFFSLIIFFSCDHDIGTVKVQYFEATAVYGDLAEIRAQALMVGPRELSDPGKIYVGGNFILIGEEEEGIHLIDNSNPSLPQRIGFINIPGNREFFVKSGNLYAESFYDLLKIDISDLNQIKIVNRLKDVFNSPILNDEGLALLGFSFNSVTKEVDEHSNLYREILDGSIVYYDFAQNIIPKSSVPASFAGSSKGTAGTVNRLTFLNEHIYVLGRSDMYIIWDRDFTLENHMEGIGDEMETIYPYENSLFVGTRSSMLIFNASTPRNPINTYQFDHATSCDPVLAKNNAAYVSLRTAEFSECPGNTNALIVLNITDLQNPSVTQEIEMNSPYGMALIGGRLYIGEGDNGLTIFDAENPLDLSKIKNHKMVTAYDILEHPSRSDIILITGPEGLSQYAINDHSQLALTSTIGF